MKFFKRKKPVEAPPAESAASDTAPLVEESAIAVDELDLPGQPPSGEFAFLFKRAKPAVALAG